MNAPLTREDRLAHAVHYRNQLWSGSWLQVPEDRRITRLQALCAQLCGGDREAGKQLATEAIWS